jgi:glycosyltransferase involved in cell wall biosynthesis
MGCGTLPPFLTLMDSDFDRQKSAPREGRQDSPRVSVVIPTYNHAEFLGKALASVRDQTFGDWEIIVVNNFSTDGTEDIIAAFNDSRIRLVNFANHGVIAASRNFGIAQTKGEFVAFLDSDDCWYPKKLELSVHKLDSGCDLVCHGEAWVIEENGQRRVRNVIYGPEQRASFSSLLFDGNCISTSAVVVRRQCLEMAGCFDEAEDIVTAEDYHLWLKLARTGARIGFLSDILGEYRIHPGNTSKAGLRNMQAIHAVFEKVYADLPVRPVSTKILAHRRRAIIDYSGARVLQDNGDHLQARKWFLRAIRRWPFMPKMYVALLINAAGKRLSH